jgi:hypothetical protein
MPIHKLVLGTALLALMAGPAVALDVAALKPGVEAEVAADYPIFWRKADIRLTRFEWPVLTQSGHSGKRHLFAKRGCFSQPQVACALSPIPRPNISEAAAPKGYGGA